MQGECWSDQNVPVLSRCHPESDCANVTFTFTKDVMPEVSMEMNIRSGDVLHACAGGVACV